MYLMSLVNPTFVSKRPASHVELVDLSPRANQHHHPCLVESHKEHTGLRNAHLPYVPAKNMYGHGNTPGTGTGAGRSMPYPCTTSTTSMRHCEENRSQAETNSVSGRNGRPCHTVSKPNFETVTSPECKGLKSPTRDLQMEPLYAYVDAPGSPDSVLSESDDATLNLREIRNRGIGLLEEVDEEISLEQRESAPKQFNIERAEDQRTSLASSEVPALRTSFSGGESTYQRESSLQHHPLLLIEEDSETDEGLGDLPSATSSERFERFVGEWELENARLDFMKLYSAQEDSSPYPSPTISKEFGNRAAVVKQQPLQPNAEAAAEVAVTRKLTKFELLTKLEMNDMESPEPFMEERELRYSSPKLTEREIQNESSFRFWDRESPPKQKSSQSRSRVSKEDLQQHRFLADESVKANDRRTSSMKSVRPNRDKNCSLEDVRNDLQSLKEQLATGNVRMEEGVHYEFPSPSSYTYMMSPTSDVSDDQDPFHMDAPTSNKFSRYQKTMKPDHESPRSVLAHEMLDSSDQRESPRWHPLSTTSIYRDDSSDFESFLEGYGAATKGATPIETEFPDANDHTKTEKPYPMKFTYAAESMVESSSEEDVNERYEEDKIRDDPSELQYFQEAENWEPWLDKNGGALDPADLDFLLPPDFMYKDSDMSEEHDESVALRKRRGTRVQRVTADENARSEHAPRNWVPYVIDRASGDSPKGSSRRQSFPQVLSQFSKGMEKLATAGTKHGTAPAPNSTNVKPNPNLNVSLNSSIDPKPIRIPHSNAAPILIPNLSTKDEDETIFPSVKSWEVEEEGPSIMTSRRRWRKHRAELPPRHRNEEPPTQTSASGGRSMSFTPAPAKRSSIAMPCSGRLFSWRMMAFKVSKSRFIDSDDEHEGVSGGQSFGRSARRDSQQVKRILKGSHKKFATLTVADILKQDLG